MLFGQPIDEDRYWRVIEQACLIPDLQLLADGDLTEVVLFAFFTYLVHRTDSSDVDWGERYQLEVCIP